LQEPNGSFPPSNTLKELSGDLEIEEIVIASGGKAVRDRFEIKVVDGKFVYYIV